MDGISDKRSFLWLTIASLSPASCCRSDEHKTSVLHSAFAEDLVVHGVCFTSVQFVFPWSTTTVNARTLHCSAWSLQECRAPSNIYGLNLRALRAGMICSAISEFAKKPSVQVFTEVRSWSLVNLQFCTFVLVIECDVLSIVLANTAYLGGVLECWKLR